MLRPYQMSAVEAAFQCVCERGAGRGVIVAPTGSGKSLIIAELYRRLRESGRAVAVVVAEKSVRAQLSAVVGGGAHIYHPSQLPAPCEGAVLIVDEVHHFRDGKSWGKVWGYECVIGFTATPSTYDSSTRIIYRIPYYTLRREGWLAPPVSAELMCDGKALPTDAHLVFYLGKREEWKPEYGRLVLANTPAHERHFLGDERRLCCLQTLTTGWDDPDIEGVVLLRRIGDIHTYLQIIGRLRRGGTVYDYADNVMRFGLDEDLAMERGMERWSSAPRSSDGEVGLPPLTRCLECERLISPRLSECPYCGTSLPPKAPHIWTLTPIDAWLKVFERLEHMCDSNHPCPYTPSGAYSVKFPNKEIAYFSPRTYHHWSRVKRLFDGLAAHHTPKLFILPHSWWLLGYRCGKTCVINLEYGSNLRWTEV